MIGLAVPRRAPALRSGEPLPPMRIKGLLAVTAATVGFGALVRGAGLVVALPVLVVVSAAASARFRWGPALALAAGLSAVLRRRLPEGTRRAAARSADRGSAARRVDLLANLGLGHPDGVHGGEPLLLPARRLPRHADRRPARARPDRHDRHAAPDHVHAAADLGPHHAGGHLLRLAVRRLDDLDPGQPARRGGVGGHHARRVPDGAAGAGRRRRSPPRRSARSSPAPSRRS